MYGILAHLKQEGVLGHCAPPWKSDKGLWYSTPEAGEKADAILHEHRASSIRSRPKPFSKGTPKGGRNPDYMTMECIREETVRCLEVRPMSERELMEQMGRTRSLKKQLRVLLEEDTIRYVYSDGEWKWTLADVPMD